MNTIALVFLAVNAVLILILPRRWAVAPLLVGACYMSMRQGVEIGPFHFSAIRILLAISLVRAMLYREGISGNINALDKLMMAWLFWAVASSLLHADFGSALTYRLGQVYNTCGIYLIFRIYCNSMEDVIRLCCIAAILLIPLGLEMAFEKVSNYNLFSLLGGPSQAPTIRDGQIRAEGPFGHSILAGTVGAVCLPLMIGLWRFHRRIAMVGIIACLAIVIASASSGPVLSCIAGIGALVMWRWRTKMGMVQWTLVLGYIILELVMKAPAYYIIARLQPIGASGGYHRARLIESAIDHLNEWWIAGTDYTRHWMVTGVSWSPNHTDITNHYIKMGVIGGLPLMIIFILILAKGFGYVGQLIRREDEISSDLKFFVWTIGASLFTHASSCMSVSYFDQSYVFLYMTIAIIGSIWSATLGPEGAALTTAEETLPAPG